MVSKRALIEILHGMSQAPNEHRRAGLGRLGFRVRVDAAIWDGHVHVECFRFSGFRVLALGFSV